MLALPHARTEFWRSINDLRTMIRSPVPRFYQRVGGLELHLALVIIKSAGVASMGAQASQSPLGARETLCYSYLRAALHAVDLFLLPSFSRPGMTLGKGEIAELTSTLVDGMNSLVWVSIPLAMTISERLLGYVGARNGHGLIVSGLGRLTSDPTDIVYTLDCS